MLMCCSRVAMHCLCFAYDLLVFCLCGGRMLLTLSSRFANVAFVLLVVCLCAALSFLSLFTLCLYSVRIDHFLIMFCLRFADVMLVCCSRCYDLLLAFL